MYISSGYVSDINLNRDGIFVTRFGTNTKSIFHEASSQYEVSNHEIRRRVLVPSERLLTRF